jgi:hypothetical protein
MNSFILLLSAIEFMCAFLMISLIHRSSNTEEDNAYCFAPLYGEPGSGKVLLQRKPDLRGGRVPKGSVVHLSEGEARSQERTWTRLRDSLLKCRNNS